MPGARPELLEELRALVAGLRADMRSRWDRDLPIGELLSDRWERARELGFGEGTSIYDSAVVLFDVRVGAGTWIGPWVLLDGRGGLEIGDHCSVSAGVQVYTHDTVEWALTGGRAGYATSPVRIGSCSHLGARSTILAGVTVGHHCVVGAHSLVNSDLAPYTVAFGTPARPRGRVVVDEGAVTARVVLDGGAG
ncbi:MAG: acyltransferase [Acidimicrobiales bacterium]